MWCSPCRYIIQPFSTEVRGKQENLSQGRKGPLWIGILCLPNKNQENIVILLGKTSKYQRKRTKHHNQLSCGPARYSDRAIFLMQLKRSEAQLTRSEKHDVRNYLTDRAKAISLEILIRRTCFYVSYWISLYLLQLLSEHLRTIDR